jgi:drug/metabolite transporter (DMT)-like permease
VIAAAPDDQRITLLAGTLAGLMCVLWGANAVAIKVTLGGLGPFTAAALRFSIATVLLFAWARATGQSLAPGRRWMRPLLVNSLLFTAQLALVYVGFTLTNASRGALLTNLQPFFLTFLAHVFIPGDRITLLKVFGLVLGFSGAACVLLDRQGGAAGLVEGDLILLVATFLWACGTVYVKRIVRSIPALTIVFYQLLFSVPFFAAGALLWDPQPVIALSAEVLGALLFQGVVATAFAFVAWTRLMEAYGVVALHSFVFMIPVAGVILAGILLGEPITASIALALVLIAGGILVVQFGQRRATPPLLRRP